MQKSSEVEDAYDSKDDPFKRHYPFVHFVGKKDLRFWEEAFTTLIRGRMFGGPMKKSVPMKAKEHSRRLMD